MTQTRSTTATANIATTTFMVRKDDLRQTRLAQGAIGLDDLRPGQVLLKIDSFAFTANNITYAEMGEKMGYWGFFPAPEDGWGVIPVWGFADVIASREDRIAVDERLFGYFPMATHLVVEPAKLTDDGFLDASAHRAKLPPAYNRYMRITGDPDYAPDFEALQALLRPLFITSFLIDDFLAEEKTFGAATVMLSSASSKTAFGLAHLLHKRDKLSVIGLTSAANRAFVEGLGCYHRVVTYDAIASLDAAQPAVYVDFAGSADLRRSVHAHFGDALKYSCAVGLSHRQMNPPGKDLPGPKPVFFFAPDRIVKRNADWGRGGVDMRLNTAWRAFVPLAQGWLNIIESRGLSSVEAAYRATLTGGISPAEGHILSLWD